MSENQELKNGKWVESEPLKFKPCCVGDWIWLIKSRISKLLRKDREE